MSLIPCSACDQRQPGGVKLASVTWAWWTAHNERLAYRQRLCPRCYAQNVGKLEISTIEGALICPACGIATADDMDPCYCTAFIPGHGKVQIELPLCPSCAVPVRTAAQVGAVRLDDRPPESGGLGALIGPQTPTPSDPWLAVVQPAEA